MRISAMIVSETLVHQKMAHNGTNKCDKIMGRKIWRCKMNSQQEYEQFLAKLSKAICDLKNDFNHLSPDNQQRFAREANMTLKKYGYAITVEDLMRKYSG